MGCLRVWLFPFQGRATFAPPIDRRSFIRRPPIPLSRSRTPRRFMFTFSRILPKEHARARAHESARSARGFCLRSRAPCGPRIRQHQPRTRHATRVVGSHIFRCRCRSARCARSISFVLTSVVDLSIDDPAMPRSMPPRLAAFLRRRTFEICGFWPISRGGQIRVRGDSMFCERGCSPIFRPGCTGSTVRSCDLSETRLRMSTFPCPCASSRPFRAERRKVHSFEQTSAKAPCGNIDRPRLVSLTLVSFVLRRSRRLFFRVNRQQPVPFDRYPFGPFGGRATSLAAVTPRTLSSQPPRSLAPHGAGARENCARSSSAYCHRVAWLQCLHLSRPARASEPSIQTSALRFGHFRNLTTRANSR